MTKKFLVSTADVYGYDGSSNLVLSGKTLLDSSIETTLANKDVRAGRGNQLQYVFYHTTEMNVKISDAQWNLDFIANTVGVNKVTGANIYKEETIVLDVSKGGSVTDTPLAVTGSPPSENIVPPLIAVVESIDEICVVDTNGNEEFELFLQPVTSNKSSTGIKAKFNTDNFFIILILN